MKHPNTKVPKRQIVIAAVVGLFALGFLFSLFAPAELPKTAAPSPTKRASVAPDPQAKMSALVAWYDKIAVESRPCELAMRKISSAVTAGDRYAGYEVASSAQEVCREAAAGVAKLDPPTGLSPDGQDAIEGVITTCAYVNTARQGAASATAKVMDGDDKPSSVSDVKEKFNHVDTANLACAAKIVGLVSGEGIDPKKFMARVSDPAEDSGT